MGAWGSGVFDNDSVLDWVFELEESGIDAISSAFAAVLDADGYIEVDEGSAALGAAEIVAALSGKPMKGTLPEDVQTFLASKPVFDADLVARAKLAVARVQAADSELRELWEESDSFDEWNGIADDLSARLS